MEQASFYGVRKGEYNRIIESAADNNSERSRIEFINAPGISMPVHYHTDFDKQIEITEGELSLWTGKTKTVLKAGDKAVILRNTKHRWENETNKECRGIITTTPGQIHYEHMSRINAGLYKEGLVDFNGFPRNPLIRSLFVIHGSTVLYGLTSFCLPVLRWLYGRAKKKGLYEELLNKYSANPPKNKYTIQLQQLSEAIGA